MKCPKCNAEDFYEGITTRACASPSCELFVPTGSKTAPAVSDEPGVSEPFFGVDRSRPSPLLEGFRLTDTWTTLQGRPLNFPKFRDSSGVQVISSPYCSVGAPILLCHPADAAALKQRLLESSTSGEDPKAPLEQSLPKGCNPSGSERASDQMLPGPLAGSSKRPPTMSEYEDQVARLQHRAWWDLYDPPGRRPGDFWGVYTPATEPSTTPVQYSGLDPNEEFRRATPQDVLSTSEPDGPSRHRSRNAGRTWSFHTTKESPEKDR